LYKVCEQAKRDAEAAGKLDYPIVMQHRKSRENGWIVVMELDDFEIYEKFFTGG